MTGSEPKANLQSFDFAKARIGDHRRSMNHRLFLKLILGLLLAVSLTSTASAETAPKEEKACAAGDLDACADLGDMYIQGKIGDHWDFETHEAIAIPMLLDACDRGGAKACEVVGKFYLEVEMDPTLSTGYLIQGCNGGRASSCSLIAHILSSAKYGIANDEKAVAYNEKACTLDARSIACIGLADAYDLGKGVEKDIKKASTLLELSCANNWKIACMRTASRYKSGKGVDIDFAKAAAFSEAGCKEGLVEPCRTLGELYETGGPNLPSNKKKARKYYKKACKIYSPSSCDKVKALSK